VFDKLNLKSHRPLETTMAMELTPEQQALVNQQTAEAQQRALQYQVENDNLRLQLQSLVEQMGQLQARIDAPAAVAPGVANFTYKPKIPEPPSYNGRERLDAWGATMTQYLEVLGLVNSPAGAQVASFYLKGPMQRVYTLHKEDVASGRVAPLANFPALMTLLKQHRPEPDHYRSARESIEHLRQPRGQLDKYCTTFLSLWQDVRQYMSEVDGVWHFTRGLERELQTEVHKVTVTTDPLEKVIATAYRLDEVLYASKRSARLYGSGSSSSGGDYRRSNHYRDDRRPSNYSSGSGRNDHSAPMELGSRDGLQRGNDGRYLPRGGGRSNQGGYSGGRGNKPRGDGCWVCGEPDHFSRECPRNLRGQGPGNTRPSNRSGRPGPGRPPKN
jgi:Retrotransposon gag protein/Zinc knuckle